MKQAPGSKLTPAPCDACGRPKVALYTVEGREICMDCYEEGPRPEPKPTDPLVMSDADWIASIEARHESTRMALGIKVEDSKVAGMIMALTARLSIVEEKLALSIAGHELYADQSNWGDTNQNSTGNRWKNGKGFGPARRLLKRLRGE